MPATSKDQLIRISDQEFERLLKLVVTIDTDMAVAKSLDDTSIKDVVPIGRIGFRFSSAGT